MTKNKIAVLSDIHGNSWALNTVLSDIKSKGIKTIINLGDCLYGPLDPKGTFDLLSSNDILSISGNQDRIILENLNIKSDMITLEYVKENLDNDAIDWLKELPFDFIHENYIYGCHGIPANDSVYLLESLQTDNVTVKGKEEIDDLLDNIKQKIIVCGHSHVPRIVETNKKIVINPGSVGLPAYNDDLPIPHKMENFNSHARYSTLTFTKKSVNIDQIAISYDYEEAARMAEKNKRNDWAKWIRTGRV